MSSSQPAIPTDPDAIERAIDQRQESLARTVDELVERVKPQNLLQSGKEAARAKARGFLGLAQEQARGAGSVAKDAMTTPEGETRTERVAAVAAGTASVILFAAWIATRNKV